MPGDDATREAMAASLAMDRSIQTYRGGTQRVVRTFQDEQGLTSSGEVDAETASAINAILRDLGLLQRSGGLPTYVVRGRVIDDDSRGVAGLEVEAVDRNVGATTSLGAAVTDAEGRYEISYHPRPVLERKRGIDVQVLVVSSAGTRLGESDVRYDARPIEARLNVVIANERAPREAEYGRLLDDLGAHLEATDRDRVEERLATLREDADAPDLTYLSNKSGWDARMVAMSALASRFARQTSVKPEFYYALFRAGIPANEVALSRLAPDALQGTFERAVEQGILAPDMRSRIPEALQRLRRASIRHWMTAPAEIGPSGFRDLVAGALVDEPDQRRLAELYHDERHDPSSFWAAVRREFPAAVDRLQLDSDIAGLTINNAPLIRRLHQQIGELRRPVDLIRGGLYRVSAWADLLDDSIVVPAEIPGDNSDARRANYSRFMVDHLRLAYPTAVVADMVRSDHMLVGIDSPLRTAVSQFLTQHDGEFELALQPVELFLRQRSLVVDAPVVGELKKLQRLFQITPTEEAMATLARRGLDSAAAVVRYDESTFVSRLSAELGDPETARLVYAKAHQVHHAVINLATTYVLERSTPFSGAVLGQPSVAGEPDDTGVLAYPTLESLFGQLDYCACEHCRSWLSPAAYLVDLLLFLDVREPIGTSPLAELLRRRPDIQHLPLTCENTNTALPYLDIVNEIMEHALVTSGTLAGFTGHDTDPSLTTEELMASPQFVNDAAYTMLHSAVFPLRLPFHRPLVALRQHFGHFEIPLYRAMEDLRANDDDVGDSGTEGAGYGWRDVLIERLELSRSEFTLLTDASTPLAILYGSSAADDATLVAELAEARTYARKLGLSYEEMISLVRSRFVNPGVWLLSRLERLNVDLVTLQSFFDGNLTATELTALLPSDLASAIYGGNVIEWLRAHELQIMRLIVLVDASEIGNGAKFADLQLRYALPDMNANQLRPVEFLKLLRMIRLWRKLGWTIEQTDLAISALYPEEQLPLADDDEPTARAKLDTGFSILLLRLAELETIMQRLGLQVQRDLASVLALWAPIDTHGPHSLYSRMFLNPTILSLDDHFAEDGHGGFLQDPTRTVFGHVDALRAAFNLTQADFELIANAMGIHAASGLDVQTVSAVYRRAFLARALRISIRELLALMDVSGLDPFAPLDLSPASGPASAFGAVRPPTIRFLELVAEVRESPLSIARLVYLLQHVDLSGRASPSQSEMFSFARTVRDEFRRIDAEHVVEDDPTGEIASTRMALVYGNDSTDTFFGLLNDSTVFAVSYDHGQVVLDEGLSGIADRLDYDDFDKQLRFSGVMTPAQRAAFAAAPGAPPAFQAAISALFAAGEAAASAFFDRFPELQDVYETLVNARTPVELRQAAVLTELLPELRERLKRQQLRQTIAAHVDVDPALLETLLGDPLLLHATGGAETPAADDLLAMERGGLTADIFFGADLSGAPDLADFHAPQIDYRAGGNGLPTDPVGGGIISGIWHGFVEVLSNTNYNFWITTDADADIELQLDNAPIALTHEDGVWRNQDAIPLEAGRFYALRLTARGVSSRLTLAWQHRGMGRLPIPTANLLPARAFQDFSATYLRLSKALALAEALGLSADEFQHLAARPDHGVAEEGWLNALPVAAVTDPVAAPALMDPLLGMIRYRSLKAALGVHDDRLITALRDPEAVDEDGGSIFQRVTGWDPGDQATLLAHFGIAPDALGQLHNVLRLHRAFAIVEDVGIGANALLRYTTNEPSGESLRGLQSALRARYDAASWLQVIQPINDALRVSQRDALVAGVLQRLSQNNTTAHIDTPDKLFEMLLVDVQMDACMPTSRIRLAISSVQTFVQRCMMNLEPRVEAGDIIADIWAQISRYRLWEVQRKIFLWPENWLDAKRDDESPFFKELESELLQGEITDDAAATALVHYLERLTDVAKLEICGMCREGDGVWDRSRDVVHVIGRIPGARRTYYYRRQDGGVAWSPWQEVNLAIDDNPVLPVVWNGRLFLFWLTVVPAGEVDQPEADSDSETALGDMTRAEMKEIGGEVESVFHLTLHWSEHYNGSWHPERTSDLDHPIVLGPFPPSGPGAFDRRLLRMIEAPRPWSKNSLTVSMTYPGREVGYFTLHNTHSLPMHFLDDPDVALAADFPLFGQNNKVSRTFSDRFPPFTVTIGQSVQHRILNRGHIYNIVAPRHPQAGSLEATPFFYQDLSHTFYVEPEPPIWFMVAEALNFGVQWAVLDQPIDIPVLVRPEVKPPRQSFAFSFDALQPGQTNIALTKAFLDQNTPVFRGLGTGGVVQFGDRLIGPGGSIRRRDETG